MIFYFEATTKECILGMEQEKGLIVAPNYRNAAKQIEDAMYDILFSIDKLEPIDSGNILYLTDIPVSKQLVKSIKEKAVW